MKLDGCMKKNTKVYKKMLEREKITTKLNYLIYKVFLKLGTVGISLARLPLDTAFSVKSKMIQALWRDNNFLTLSKILLQFLIINKKTYLILRICYTLILSVHASRY